MSAIPQTFAPAVPLSQNLPSPSGGQMVGSAKKVALFVLGALAILANFLWLPFKIAFIVSLAEIALISSCMNLHSDPPASVLPIPIPTDPQLSRPISIRPTIVPVVFEMPPKETACPRIVRQVPPVIAPPPRMDPRPREKAREKVGDGHLNPCIPSARIVSPPPVFDPRPRETVGDGHLNRVPAPAGLPSRVIDPRPREPVGDGHRNPQMTVLPPPRSIDPRPREQVGGGHRVSPPLIRPDTPRPAVRLNPSQGLAPQREPVGNRNPK